MKVLSIRARAYNNPRPLRLRLGDQPPRDGFRFPRASSWTFFIKVCSGLQQISQRSRLSSGMSCLSPLAPLIWTRAQPRLLSASRKQQSQTNVVFVPIGVSRLPRLVGNRFNENRQRKPARSTSSDLPGTIFRFAIQRTVPIPLGITRQIQAPDGLSSPPRWGRSFGRCAGAVICSSESFECNSERETRLRTSGPNRSGALGLCE